ncbi:DUF421 domain-containing protein [Kocuria sp.]|uniref:DUF421 domain-containing protein n=1 Tax=Kocuria sp. TaxID=1871328 RepID=UPI0026DF36FC|nr:YetF domain-containing protein [Kocuria sp.]MDO5619017.1 DUF421 domain-containing protein [Kocuria sp.]
MVANTWAAMWSDLMSMQIPPTDKIIRTVVVYLFIALLIRVAGKRLMAQMNSLDLVVVLLLSNVVQNAIIGPDNSLLGGLVGAVVLVFTNFMLERATHQWPAFGRFLEGKSTQLVTDGDLDRAAMMRLGLNLQEINAALRHQGADDVSEVRSASLAPGGGVVVTLRHQDQNASIGDLEAAMAQLHAKLDTVLAALPHAADTAPDGQGDTPGNRPSDQNGH